MNPAQVHAAKMRSIGEQVIADLEKYIRSDQNSDPTVIMCPYLPISMAEIEVQKWQDFRTSLINYVIDRTRDFDRLGNVPVDRLQDTAQTTTPTEVPNDAPSPAEVRQQKKPRKKPKPRNGT